MKKLVISIIALLVAAQLSAQNYDFNRVEVEVGVSGVTWVNTFLLFGISDLAHAGSGAVDKYGHDGHERAPEFIVPLDLSFGARYNVLKWLSVGGQLEFQHLQSKSYVNRDKENGGSKEYAGLHSMTAIAVMPEIRFTYYRWEKVSLYGDLELGASIINWECEKEQAPQARFAFNASPIGVQFGGGNLFGLAEIGIGMEWAGLKAGLGYRF